MQYTIDIEPLSEVEARISFIVEADDWVEAMRVALAEIGLGETVIESASCEMLSAGLLRIQDPATGRVYKVSERPEAKERRVETAEMFVAPEAEDAAPKKEVSVGAVPAEGSPETAGEAAANGVLEGDDEELLDESLLERYFDDDPDDEDAPEAPDEHTPPGSAVAETPREGDEAAAVEALVREENEGVKATASGVWPSEEERRIACIDNALGNLREYRDGLDDAADFACFSLVEPLGADVVSLLLLDKKQKSLQFGGIAGEAPKRLGKFRYPKGLGLPWVALEQGIPLLVNHVERDERFYKAVVKKTGFRVNATILAPVIFEGRGLGVLQAVRSASDAPGFQDFELRLLQAAAAHVGDYLAYYETF